MYFMSMSFRLKIFLLLILGLTSIDAVAQRLVNGEHMVGISANCWNQYGIAVDWGMCTHGGKIIGGATYLSTSEFEYYVAADDEIPEGRWNVGANDWYASGGYMFRIISNRRRDLNLWLGGTLDFGARQYLLPNGTYGIPKAKFLYGLSPKIEFEYFPSTTFSMSIFAEPRIQCYGHSVFDKVFYFEIGIAFNFYFMP